MTVKKLSKPSGVFKAQVFLQTPFRHQWCFFARWTGLPDMPKGSSSQAALFVGHGEDDATFLVVGIEISFGEQVDVCLRGRLKYRLPYDKTTGHP